MGVLDFEHERYHLTHVRRTLARRRLKPDLERDWEIHGPHQDMSYHVYVGYAYSEAEEGARCICPGGEIQYTHCPAHKHYYCVAIYPRAVYEIEQPWKWWDIYPENRISTERPE